MNWEGKSSQKLNHRLLCLWKKSVRNTIYGDEMTKVNDIFEPNSRWKCFHQLFDCWAMVWIVNRTNYLLALDTKNEEGECNNDWVGLKWLKWQNADEKAKEAKRRKSSSKLRWPKCLSVSTNENVLACPKARRLFRLQQFLGILFKRYEKFEAINDRTVWKKTSICTNKLFFCSRQTRNGDEIGEIVCVRLFK